MGTTAAADARCVSAVSLLHKIPNLTWLSGLQKIPNLFLSTRYPGDCEHCFPNMFESDRDAPATVTG